MTLIIAIRLKDRILMSADSRLTMVPVKETTDDNRSKVVIDNIQKIWALPNSIGISNCGSWPITQYSDGHFSPTVLDLINEFSKECNNHNIDEIAILLKQRVYADIEHKEASFLVCGFNSNFSRIYSVWYDKESDEPKADLVGNWIWYNGNYQYAGYLTKKFMKENELTSRTLTETDAIRLIKYVVEESEVLLHQNGGEENIGGPIDILRITKDGISWIQHK